MVEKGGLSVKEGGDARLNWWALRLSRFQREDSEIYHGNQRELCYSVPA